MLAYHSDPKIKTVILQQLRAHAKADEIVKGKYWSEGKGCAVGCTIHSGLHVDYETRFGIPQMLAWLEDTIFERLPNERAKEWPIQFMSAIVPGVDLSLVGWKFLHWILTDEAVNPGINHPTVKDAIKQCADVVYNLSNGGVAGLSRNAARSAAESAESAARSCLLYTSRCV